MFKSIFSTLLLATTLCVAPPVAGTARGQDIWNPRELLRQHFRTSERVTHLRVAPSGEQRARVEARIGRSLPKPSYTFFVATTGDKVDGYALFDDQIGQHEPISFATFFDVQGRVTRVEIVAYREAYGDGIRDERFRRQFVGRSARSSFRHGEDIDAVSGATISSRSMCIGVARAAALFDETIAKQAPDASRAAAPTAAAALASR